MYYILSILLGLIPEVLYFTLFITYTKHIREHRIKFFILFILIYILCILFTEYKIIYYLAFIASFYIILKIVYKEKAQIIDIFVFSIAFMYLALCSFICSLFIANDVYKYYLLMIIDRILLFIPFIFRHKFNKIYKKYASLWNRDDMMKKPIKSITLRNISLICLNAFVFIANILLIEIMK